MKQLIKQLLNNLLDQKTYSIIHGFYLQIIANINSNNLNRLAEIYGSDKYGHHFYTPYYMSLFLPLRMKKLRIMEIGIGGYEDGNKGGASLLMWQKFFSNSMIYAIDLYDKSKLNSKKIKTFMGSQTDNFFLYKVIETTGKLDIIIDDGSHNPNHQVESFKILFPFVKAGGYYIVEDTSTSYSPGWGGSEDIYSPHTFLNFAKKLTDCVNYDDVKDKISEDFLSTMQEIEFVNFYRDLVILKKKK
jgi:hypothetical protein